MRDREEWVQCLRRVQEGNASCRWMATQIEAALSEARAEGAREAESILSQTAVPVPRSVDYAEKMLLVAEAYLNACRGRSQSNKEG